MSATRRTMMAVVALALALSAMLPSAQAGAATPRTNTAAALTRQPHRARAARDRTSGDVRDLQDPVERGRIATVQRASVSTSAG